VKLKVVLCSFPSNKISAINRDYAIRVWEFCQSRLVDLRFGLLLGNPFLARRGRPRSEADAAPHKDWQHHTFRGLGSVPRR